ncbi:hypothetical protein ANOBCDAF_00415 [Pleomorphomonas sp. T1.2MG-36]|uniref:hypothetical protein n=1 Tax=Pleomorphomonas sp. T1.2MG-36 TaxID=3041167 RepID=UPI00247749F4|nr:hypothetical protein [Pleomorphomonas sp. T1.2MG-36]CAI9400102.1 hypothetical protein ANOBCDAF_00415 [Pleomorphomonas sp. T1.2MG-36]
MDRLYNSRTAEQRATIDALVAEATKGQMSEARRICDAAARGYFFDPEAADPKALEIARAFLGNA